MKKLLLIFSFISIPLVAFSQVGVGTDTPTAMLDIAGQVRVRSVPVGTARQAQDSILVVDGRGYLRTVSSSTVENTSLVSFVRGSGASGALLLGVSLGTTGFSTLRFDDVNSGNVATNPNFDVHGDYNVSTYQFTAPKTGVYSIFVQFTQGSIVSLGTVGVGIIKIPNGSTTPTLVAQDTYPTVSLASAFVRKTSTILKLNAGDKITFGLNAGITVLGAITANNTFFTIHQIH